jgi:hypothetical protein
MSAAAALAFTLLFVPDEPRAPAVVVDVREAADGRTADVVVVPAPPNGTPWVGRWTAPPLAAPTTLRTLPVAPPGVVVVEAVDGVLVTIDDAAREHLVAPPVPSASAAPAPGRKAGGSRSEPSLPSLVAPPDLPIAAAPTLRIFVPTVVLGRPQPASIHGMTGGTRVVVAGQALVHDGTRPAMALSVADVDDGRSIRHAFDGTAAVVEPALAGACGGGAASWSARALQRTTHLAVALPACTGRLVVGVGSGMRLGDRPERDRSAWGIVVELR